jgi:hypothetical protein
VRCEVHLLLVEAATNFVLDRLCIPTYSSGPGITSAIFWDSSRRVNAGGGREKRKGRRGAERGAKVKGGAAEEQGEAPRSKKGPQGI